MQKQENNTNAGEIKNYNHEDKEEVEQSKNYF